MEIEAAGHLFKKIGNHDPKTIAKVLMNGKSHPLIKLENNDLGDEGVTLISKALRQQAIVSSLDLSSNKITDIGVKELCSGIESNQYLLFLKLDNNPIGNQGFKHICSTLKSKSCTLKSLYVSDCNITHQSMEYLVDALSVNKSLETLHLNSNKIQNEGADILSKLINQHCRLKNLSLFFCGIGDSGANSLLTRLDKPDFIKYSLLALTIKGNKINTGIMEQITKILIEKKNFIKAEKMKAEHQKLIDEEAQRVVKLKMMSVNEEVEKKIKTIDEEAKRKLEEKIKDIDEESKKKLDERINNINEETKKKLNEKMKTIEKKEETLNARDSEFSNRVKQFEKEKKKKSDLDSSAASIDATNKLLQANSAKKPIKKKYSDSIIIVIAGDKNKDKELLIDYCMSILEECRIEAENDFEKIFTGIIEVDNKPIHFTFVNTSSDDRYSRLRALQYEQADAAVIAFTTNDRVSFEDIPFQWIPEIEFMGKIPIFIAGMYPDKRSNPPKSTDISIEEGRTTSLKFGASNYFEPTNPLDIKNISQIIYKDIKKKKK